jgi:hypothetical protein
LNRVWIVLFALLIAAGIALSALLSRDAKPIQPQAQLTGDQTSLLTQVEITPAKPTLMGRDVCRECHAENYQLHGNHGHKSTFASTSDPEIIEMFVGKSYDAGQPYGTYTYHADEQGLFARIPEKFGDQPFRLNYALGSADGAVTLLSLMPSGQQGTVAIEHRASWFSGTGELGPTPLEESGSITTPGEFFGLKHEDEVMRKCVYCHTTRGRIVDQQIVDLVPNVNCEKCHGPASEHVRQARAMPVPPKFSVGRDDWDTESEMQLCGDCHRLPAAVSRTSLREYPREMVRFQPVGLLRSKCFVESEGKLKCTTCHNPHQTVKAVSNQQYLQNCVSCHLEDSQTHVACPISPKQGCIDCHMPAIEIPGLGVSFHDHWIRVRDEE